MPTVREVVQALGSRDAVEAVIVLGHDGLTIDAHVSDGLDADALSALVPTVVASCNGLGSEAGSGEFGTGVVAYGNGLVIITEVTPETLLAIFVKAETNIGSLLYELRRHRPALASLL